MAKKYIYVVTGHSESGDDYGPMTVLNKPTGAELKKWAHDCDGDEDEEGPGDYGSYVHVKVVRQEVLESLSQSK